MASVSPSGMNALLKALDAGASSVAKAGEAGAPQQEFSNILQQAIDLANQTDDMDTYSALNLVTGNVDDLAGVMIDAQKAEIALNLTIQIRNKVLEAYSEIMNMQV